MTNMESPRNVFWDQSAEGVTVTKKVGEGVTAKVLWTHTYTPEQFAAIISAVTKPTSKKPASKPDDALNPNG